MLRGLHEDDPEGGYRVLADDLHDLGYRVSERRVWRLCRLAGIRSVITTRKRRYQKAGVPVHDDLVKRDFTAEGPNQLWLTDITVASSPPSHGSPPTSRHPSPRGTT
ncbi:hypothetical protein GCM10027064_24700 [Microbacterium petrolearium]